MIETLEYILNVLFRILGIVAVFGVIVFVICLIIIVIRNDID